MKCNYLLILIITFIFSTSIFAKRSADIIHTVPTLIQKDIDLEETPVVRAVVIKYNKFDQPTCSGDCDKKALIGIGFNYRSEIRRATGNVPNEIVNDNSIFPYYTKRKFMSDNDFKNRRYTSLVKHITAAKLRAKSAIVLLDVHGLGRSSPQYPNGGILLPQNENCDNYRQRLKGLSGIIKTTQPNDPSYGQLVSRYKSNYKKYTRLLCHQRVLPYNNYENVLHGPIVFHFNASEVANKRGIVGSEYGLFASLSATGTSLREQEYYTANPLTKPEKIRAYMGSSKYKNDLARVKDCSNDIDQNGQIQFNEVYEQLNSIHYTDGLKSKKAEKLYDWNNSTIRKMISTGKHSMENLFKSNLGKYSKNYRSTTNSPGFSVIYNISNCPLPPTTEINAVTTLLSNSQSVRKKEASIPTPEILELSKKNFVVLENTVPLRIEAKKKKIKHIHAVQGKIKILDGNSKIKILDGNSKIKILDGNSKVKKIHANKKKIKFALPEKKEIIHLQANKKKIKFALPEKKEIVHLQANKKKIKFINKNHTVSTNSTNFIMELEGGKPSKNNPGYYDLYPEYDGTTVLGFGHVLNKQETDNIIKKYPNRLIPQDVVQRYLRDDLTYFSREVDKYVNPSTPLTENQRSALIAFAYQKGVGGMKRSQLVKLINSGASLKQIKEDWLNNYNTARTPDGGSKYLQGLYNRRLKEWNMFIRNV